MTQTGRYLKFSFLSLLLTMSLEGVSQIDDISQFRPDPEKEQKFLPYLAVRHGGMEGIETWKSNNTILYFKELWYYTESFYIRRNYHSTGEQLNESIIDISRFESSRKEDEEAIVTLGGFRDVLVLIPSKKLLYKPDQK